MRALDNDRYDALREVISIGIGRAAAALNDIVDAHVRLELPALSVCRVSQLGSALPEFDGKSLGMVSMAFTGSFTGSSGFIIAEEDALALAATLAGDQADAIMLDEMRVGALTEVGNIVLNALHGSIANGVGGHIQYTVPDFVEGTLDHLFPTTGTDAESEVLIAAMTLQVESLKVSAEIVTVFEVATVEELTRVLQGEPHCV
jgi:chemotaxis protein CheC